MVKQNQGMPKEIRNKYNRKSKKNRKTIYKMERLV